MIPPYKMEDVKNKKYLKNQNLAFQKRTAYQVKINNQWKGYVDNTNLNFLDENKLYIKSLVDYKTKSYTKKEFTTKYRG